VSIGREALKFSTLKSAKQNPMQQRIGFFYAELKKSIKDKKMQCR
jgi:hypothetical protein